MTVRDRQASSYRPIADYALIGDAQSAALVASDGSIDWLCLPYFDSPAVLCRILDAAKGGYFATCPTGPVVRTLRRYRPSSAVLETTLETDSGMLRLTDAMPVATSDLELTPNGDWAGRGRHRVIRLMEAISGEIEVCLDARIAFDFALTPPVITFVPGQGALLSAGDGRIVALAWPGEMYATGDGSLAGTLRVESGSVVACVIAYEEDTARAREILDEAEWSRQIEETDEAWRHWAAKCAADGPYQAALVRSAITLKLLTFAPTGALVAAPTTSLPEEIGGSRNWDYRFCWLRDAAFTLYTLLLIGDRDAARAFWGWIERTCGAKDLDRLQIMYGLHGERELHEQDLDHLAGYRGSKPVRVGNGAWNQRQLDIYGELLDAFWFYREVVRADGDGQDVDPNLWELMRNAADHICEVWRDKDQGLWETRGEAQHFVYSKVMCWVGLDRAIRLAAQTDLACDMTRWRSEREAIRNDILTRGFSENVGAFTMAYGSDQLDAAALRMPLVGFLPADDPRMRSTIEQIKSQLGTDCLLMRYQAEDGLPGDEGAFAICTFWLVDCLVALGRVQEAQDLFERMLGHSSDLGLFAEEIDSNTGAALGNYPQAFTHLALIDAGVDLTEALVKGE